MAARIVRADEIGEGGHQVHETKKHQRDHRELVAGEAPAHELPLRGDRELLGGTARSGRGFGFGTRHAAHTDWRMRGSSHARTMSETSVPITVRVLRIMMMLEARNRS